MIEIASKSTEIQSNWYDGKLYCFSLNINGKTGWRLPTMTELCEIDISTNDFDGDFYWSSNEDSSLVAWAKHFDYGLREDIPKNYECYVRAVRDI